MTVSWSSHAKGQRAAILRTVVRHALGLTAVRSLYTYPATP